MDVEPFSVPLAAPLTTARGTITDREGFLVRLERDGVVGVGEATPLAGWTESRANCERALERAFGAAEAGDDPLAVIEDAPAARHAVDLALADLQARHADQALYRWLGGEETVEHVPVNATVGDGEVEETAAAASDAVARGFDCLKCKVGAREVATDVERLRAVRDAVGPDVDLRADANAAWSRTEAETAFEAFASLGVSYVEQPLDPDDLDGLASLRGGPVEVAVDETLASHSASAVLDADAADVLVLKPMVLGGVRPARKVALRALEAGATPVVTTTVDAVVARTAAVHLAASLPDPPACGLATADRLAADLGPDPAPVADGSIRVPRAKGHGAGVRTDGQDVD
jgi:o-succinylbenzoate synthase